MTAIEARFAGGLGSFRLDAEFSAPLSGVTGVFGPSGCGKTTLLRCIAGLTRLAGGRLAFDGQVWQDDKGFRPPHLRSVGYVFQEASLFPHLSVHGNLLYGLRRAAGRCPLFRFEDVAGMMGLERLLARAPAALSGGERQRVAIGRALLAQPRLLLMDEPLASLDRESKDDILDHLDDLHRRLPIPVLYVSHAIGEVERLADHLVVMEAGRVVRCGPMEDLLVDLSLPFARRGRAGSVLEAEVVGFDPAYGLSELAVPGGSLIVAGRFDGTGATLRVRVLAVDVSITLLRPERSSILNVLPARIENATALDEAQVTVLLRLGAEGQGARLLSRITRKSWEALNLAPGAAVFAQIKSAAIANRTRPG